MSYKDKLLPPGSLSPQGGVQSSVQGYKSKLLPPGSLIGQVQQPQDQRSVFGKAAEFLAPTLYKTLTKDIKGGEHVTGRDILGSALEIGSFALPIGGIARGAGLAAKGLGLAAKGLGTRVLEAGAIGAIGGGMQTAGRSIGEGAPLGEVAKQTALGTAIGASFGAAFPVAGAGIGKVFRGITKPKATRISEAVNNLEDTYKDIGRGWVQIRKASQKAERITQIKNKSGTIGRTPERVLAEHGIIPEHEGTRFTTKIQANKLREEATPLIQANKTALQEAQLSTAPISIAELESKAIIRARTPENVAAGIADDLEKRVRLEFEGYRKNYGESLPLDIIDDIKIARWKQTGFSLTKEDKLASDASYLIGKSAQEAIEETAMRVGSTEVAQLNREIGDILEATKFLENLDGRAVLYGKMGKHLLRLAGAISGAQGGIPGSLAGMLGGELVGRMLISASISTPTKRIILRNLQRTQPQAYLKTLNWLEKQGLARELRLALPPASFTPLSARKIPETPLQLLPAERGSVGFDPKTGRFKKTFLSTPQSPIKGGSPSRNQETINQTVIPKKIASISPIIPTPKLKGKIPKGVGVVDPPKTAFGKKLFHGTELENVPKIQKSGFKIGGFLAHGYPQGVYFTTTKREAQNYGKVIQATTKLKLSDFFDVSKNETLNKLQGQKYLKKLNDIIRKESHSKGIIIPKATAAQAKEYRDITGLLPKEPLDIADIKTDVLKKLGYKGFIASEKVGGVGIAAEKGIGKEIVIFDPKDIVVGGKPSEALKTAATKTTPET